MNFADPELELIDPTPNVHSLFIHFDNLFFWAKLGSRAVVRWSKRMYSCAGICSYEGRGGLCDIALSEPLLKLRPRKDLVETLLHEMIHAFLFVTCKDQDRDGHGPNFRSHMHRINKFSGLNISVYHDFHDEVALYQIHWWRCNGPCQAKKPHFGIVRRSVNRAPGPTDYWWKDHKNKCGGVFTKIKEPDKPSKKKTVAKPKTDIIKYINNNNKIVNNNIPTNSKAPISKDCMCSNIPSKIKSKGASTDVVNKKEVPKQIPLFTGKGHTVNDIRNRTNSADVVETLRNVWSNKQLPSILPTKNNALVQNNNGNSVNTNKHKIQHVQTDCPPSKVKKIDNYFKTTATSVLKDVYGQDIKVTQSNDGRKLVAVNAKIFVGCPVCCTKVNSNEINRHLDECLNKDLIEKLNKGSGPSIKFNNQPIAQNQPHTDRNKLKEIVGSLPTIPTFAECHDISNFQIENKNIKLELPDSMNLSFMNELVCSPPDKSNGTGKTVRSELITVDHIKSLLDQGRRSGDLMIRKGEKIVKDSNSADVKIKIEPGTSNGILTIPEQICPCCGNKFNIPVEQHLEECLIFFENNTTIPNEGSSTDFANNAIVIDDDDVDIFDESQTLNATGTKSPCPCCLKMVEQNNMNSHLDKCLS